MLYYYLYYSSFFSLCTYPQSSAHPETWWPVTSQTPVSLFLGPRPLVTFVSTGSSGSLCSLRSLEKRQYQETPPPRFWMVSPQRHAIRSLCLLAMDMERASPWTERKPQIVSSCFNSSYSSIYHTYPSLFFFFRSLHSLFLSLSLSLMKAPTLLFSTSALYFIVILLVPVWGCLESVKLGLNSAVIKTMEAHMTTMGQFSSFITATMIVLNAKNAARLSFHKVLLCLKVSFAF